MAASAEEFKRRTKAFALRVMKVVDELPMNSSVQTIGKQLFRCASSVAANYRAACRGRSSAEFVAKLGIVEEEADESVFWLEMLIDAGVFPETRLAPLKQEANEITAMIVASIRTAKGK
jgi:four helix bundle protein